MKKTQAGTTIMEVLIATALLSLMLAYAMALYSSAMNFGTSNRDAYTATMTVASCLERARWEIANSGDYSVRTLFSDTETAQGVKISLSARLEEVPGFSGEHLYRLVCDASWKGKTTSLSTLVAGREN